MACYGTPMIGRTALLPCILSQMGLAVLLAGCATSDGYPSLAPREAERTAQTTVTDTDITPPPPTSPSADTQAQVARLVGQARAAHQRFAGARRRAESLVRAAGPKGGDSWSIAAVALADLDSHRSQIMSPLSDLDSLYNAERLANFNEQSGNARAIDAARDQVGTWLAGDDMVLDALSRRLGI